LELANDGREVVGRIVPIGTPAHIREQLADGAVDEYEEVFLPGCTNKIRADARKRNGGHPSWIKLTLDHRRGLDHEIGYCTELVEQADGVDAVFMLHQDPYRLDKIRSMLAESHTGLSIEFVDISKAPPAGPVRERRQILIDCVSATPIPVYSDARILALRSDPQLLASNETPNLDRVRELLNNV
jgi:hypothetical protein